MHHPAEILAPPGAAFDAAFRAWRARFREATGYAWEDRFDGVKVAEALALAQDEIDRVYRVAAAEERPVGEEERAAAEERGRAFMYRVPRKGKPRGEMPAGRWSKQIVVE